MTEARKLKAAAQVSGALALAFILYAGASEQGTLHLAAASAVGFAAASRLPRPWAPVLGASLAAACAAALAGAPFAYGLGHGAAVGLFIWCAVRLSRSALQNLK